MELVYSFWHRSNEELHRFHPDTNSYLWTTHVGPYVRRTWTNPDGKPIATGWFKVTGQ